VKEIGCRLRKNECDEVEEGITVILKDVVCFLLGNFSASQLYMRRFVTLCLFHLHRQVGMEMTIWGKKK